MIMNDPNIHHVHPFIFERPPTTSFRFQSILHRPCPHCPLAVFSHRHQVTLKAAKAAGSVDTVDAKGWTALSCALSTKGPRNAWEHVGTNVTNVHGACKDIAMSQELECVG